MSTHRPWRVDPIERHLWSESRLRKAINTLHQKTLQAALLAIRESDRAGQTPRYERLKARYSELVELTDYGYELARAVLEAERAKTRTPIRKFLVDEADEGLVLHTSLADLREDRHAHNPYPTAWP